MAIISQDVAAQLREKRAEVFFVSGAATKWWNAKRTDKRTEICLLGGYYWTMDGQERGPFRTPSAAWRDVYYRRLLKMEPPGMDQRELALTHREIAKAKEKSAKPRSKRQGEAANAS